MLQVNVPDIVIGRLPIYLRALLVLDKAGQEFTSSQELGTKLGIGSAQIRKDLAHFGEFGKQGTGYEVKYLQQEIAKILNVDRDWAVALVGFGDLGQALGRYNSFAQKGFYIEVIFDENPQKVGKEYDNKIIQDFRNVEEIIHTREIKIAIIAVPALAAQNVAEKLIHAGIKAILNYAPVKLFVPEDVQVQYIDPISHLQQMSYYLV
jgi:redox-sensing transcriptional repressor